MPEEAQQEAAQPQDALQRPRADRRMVVMMPEELYEACRTEASYMNHPGLSSWVRHVLGSAVRRYQSQRERKGLERDQAREKAGKGLWPSGWPRELGCIFCATRHDPVTSHNLGWSWYRAPGDWVYHYEVALESLPGWGGSGAAERGWKALCARFSVARSEVERQRGLYRLYGDEAFLARYDEALLGARPVGGTSGTVTYMPPPSELEAYLASEGACARCGLAQEECSCVPSVPSVPNPVACQVCGRSYQEHSDADVAHCAGVLAGL